MPHRHHSTNNEAHLAQPLVSYTRVSSGDAIPIGVAICVRMSPLPLREENPGPDVYYGTVAFEAGGKAMTKQLTNHLPTHTTSTP